VRKTLFPTLALILLFSHVNLHGQNNRLLGNWGGARDSLQNQGVHFNFIYSAMPVFNLDGGIKTGFRYIDNVDITTSFDFDKLLSVKGLSSFVYVLGNNGDFATELVGDAQTISNIEAFPTWKIYEAWVQQIFFNNRISILAGLYDLNSEFDVIKPALLFTHSSYGLGAELGLSGVNGPSVFPVTSLAIRASANIGDRLIFKAAVLDGVPGDPNDPEGTHIILSDDEGALIIAQANINLGAKNFIQSSKSRKAGSVRRRAIGRGYETPDANQLIIGAWRYTAPYEILDQPGVEDRGNQGVFASYHRYFYLNKKRTKNITTFIRLGLAEDKFNQFSTAISGGIVTAFPIFNNSDKAGIAFSKAINGSAYKESLDQQGIPYDNSETNVELTLNHNILPYIAIQPSLQYIINPSTNSNLDNSLAFLLLLQVEL